MFGFRPVAATCVLSLLVVSAWAGCGDDAAATADAAFTDAAMSVDAVPRTDGGSDARGAADASEVSDARAEDASPELDAEILPDARPPVDADLSPCNALAFGAPAATLVQVASLPTMTGGTIPPGIYDAVEFKMITTITTGTFRAAWQFEAGTILQTIQQIVLNGGTPPTPTPRTATYSTAGTTLTQTRTCGGDTTLTNEYTVRIEGANTFLDVRANTVMFTFQKR